MQRDISLLKYLYVTPYKMMRLVISPSRRYHLGRQQQGFQTAITSASTATSTQSRINWTFSWSLDKQRRKRNNEHKLPSSLPSSSPSSSSSFTTTVASIAACTTEKSSSSKRSIPVPSFHFPHNYHLHDSLFSRSPLLPLHHILPSRRVTTTTCAADGTGTLIQTKSSASSHHLLKLARIGGGHGRFQGKMNILNRRLHSSSSPPSYTSVHSLFSFSTSTASPAMVAPPFPPLSSTPNARFISTFSSAPGENSEFFHISPEVRQAVMENSPVVALESAIITHGMPFPDNIDTAFQLESIIRKHGAVPATVGVVNGRVTVGLSSDEIKSLGEWANRKGTTTQSTNRRSQKNPVVKVSRRDVPFVIAHKLSGGTTVSGTITAAVKAGIPIFATGGLGGVHRGAETSFDISADLKELGRNPIGVVSAGVKSILDIGKTLEYMETEGVCVAVLQKGKSTQRSEGQQREKVEEKGDDSGIISRGYEGGKDKEVVAATVHGQIGNAKFPSFFTSESPFTAPYSVQSEMEAASLIHAVFQFQLNSGVLIAVPIPKDEEAATGKVIEDAIKSALEEAERSSVQGKDMTPFLLGEVNRLTGGLSLKANKHLIENNVRSACGIATHLAQLRRRGEEQRTIPDRSLSRSSSDNGSGGGESNSFSKGGGCSSITKTGQRFSPGNENQLENDSSSSQQQQTTIAKGRHSRDPVLIETIGKSTITSGENVVEEHSNETTKEGLSTTTLYDKAHSRHNKPVVIGGTSLDLVLAIQEKEIVVFVAGHFQKT